MSYQQDNFREIADAIREKKGSTALIKPIDFASEIMGISGGGAASQEIFTGYTMPVTYLNCADNTFIYESETHNLAISGLDAVATVTGNGTKKVTVVANVTFTNDEQTSFTITCTKDLESVTYNGIAFHYGNAVASGNCLAVVKTVAGSPLSVKYVFIESVSLPTFSSDTTTWNGVYSYQVESFTFAEFSVSSIGDYFLSSCYSFNQPLTIPSAVLSIGSSFLRYCYSFNQPLTIPSAVSSIGNYFLSSCYSFNQPLTIPSAVLSIGDYFLSSCYSFNQPLTIPSAVLSIGSSFLRYCYSFNQPLTIPSAVSSIGDYFLSSCYSFNQPLTIPSAVLSIGSSFLRYCYSFNQPLTIPSAVSSIGNYFLSSCYSFNQPLTIPSAVSSIGNYFLYQCQSFNQPLTIPSAVLSIGSSFLYQCQSFVYISYNTNVYPTDDQSLSQTVNSKTSTTGSGIVVSGTNKNQLIAALPDRTTTPFRKLVLGA